MNRTSAQKISDVLIVLSILLLFCDILALPLIPALVFFRFHDPSWLWSVFQYDFDDGIGNLLRVILEDAWQQPHTAVLSLFLLVCAICAAVILVQAIRILATVADGIPFSLQNSVSLKRAAASCFVISAAALARTVFGIVRQQSFHPLFSYSALFVPLFLMAGLLCLIMSGLFCQATEIKSENDLTI